MSSINIEIIIDGKSAIAEIKNVDKFVGQLQRTASKPIKIADPIPQGGVQKVQSMNQAMGQLGYAVGDANMFMVDFRMGMMSIGNNIPIIAEGFMRASREAKDLGQSVGKTLVSSLAGPGGLMLAINGVMFLLQVLPGLFDTTTQSVEEQQKAIKLLKDEYRELTQEQLKNKKAEAILKYAEASGSFFNKESWITSATPFGLGGVMTNLLAGSEKEEMNKALNVLNAIADVEKQTGDKVSLENQKKQIEQKINELRNTNTKEGRAQLKQYQNEIAQLDKQLDIFDNKKDKSNEKEKTALQILDDKLKKSAQLSEMDERFIDKNITLLESTIKGLQSKGLENLTSEQLSLLDSSLKAYAKEFERKYIIGVRDRLTAQLGTDIQAKGLDNSIKPDLEKKELKDLREYGDERMKLEMQEANELADMEKSNFVNKERAITEIKEKYSRIRSQIDQEEAEATVNAMSNAIGQIASIFNKHTVAYKAMAIAQATIDTYKGANAQLGLPFPMNFIAVAATIASGLAQVANIVKVDTSVKGYAKGGLLPKGQAGYIEGWHDEIIAPKDTFIDVMRNDLMPKVLIGGNNSRLEQLLEQALNRPSVAFISESDFKKASRNYSASNRKGRL